SAVSISPSISSARRASRAPASVRTTRRPACSNRVTLDSLSSWDSCWETADGDIECSRAIADIVSSLRSSRRRKSRCRFSMSILPDRPYLLHRTRREHSLDPTGPRGQSGVVTSSSTSSTTATAGVGGAAPSGGVPMTPILFILGSCISLQFGAALAMQLFPAIGSWGTTALRLGLAAAVLIVIVRPKVHRFTRQQWLGVAAFGVAVGGMNGAFYASIDRIPLGTAVAIEF